MKYVNLAIAVICWLSALKWLISFTSAETAVQLIKSAVMFVLGVSVGAGTWFEFKEAC